MQHLKLKQVSGLMTTLEVDSGHSVCIDVYLCFDSLGLEVGCKIFLQRSVSPNIQT